MAIRLDTYYEENKNLSLKDVMKKIMEIEAWLNSDERKAYEEAEMAKPIEERIDSNIIHNYKSELKVLRRIEKEQSEKLDETFKLSNGKYATDLETKEAFDNYMNKVNRYNEQVANGETPDVSMGDILNEYTNTFYDEELEAKLKKTEENFNNNEKGANINDLINKIDEKLENINEPKFLKCPVCGENLMYMQPDATTLYCKKCNKNFKNNNGTVGEETSYPYTDPNADY